MVTGWRRAFCTSIPKDREPKPPSSSSSIDQQHCDDAVNHRSPKISSKFGFFSSNSNPSTPRLQCQPVASPGLRCRTTPSLPNSPKLRCHISNNSVPSSPKSPSTFSLLKLRVLSKTRCGICVQSVKSGQGTAIFTAECSHSFHFPCIAAQVKRNGGQVLTCPVCSAAWKELPLLSLHHHHEIKPQSNTPTKTLRVYDDDEPLMSPTAGSAFVPIPEEGDDESGLAGEDFRGFFVNRTPRLDAGGAKRSVEVKLLPEAAIVASGRGYETYAVVMKVSPAAISGGVTALMDPTRRAPVDLVTVVDVGSAITGIHAANRAMRLIVSSLGSSDRLSIVAFSSLSKRLLPLRRMNGAGKRSARRIADALGAVSAAEKGISVGDAVKKAVKILEDRREKNPVATIALLSDSGHTSASAGNFPVHTVGLAEADPDALARRVAGLLRVTARDLHLRLSVLSRSSPPEISAVYSLAKRPTVLCPSLIRLGDLHAEEEREFLVEIRVHTCSPRSHHVLSVRSTHSDPSSAEIIHSGDYPLLVPRPQTIRSNPNIERLRNLHVVTCAVAESRRLTDQGDLSGARRLLSSARALLAQSKSASADEFSVGLEAEISELNRLRIHQRPAQRSSDDNKVEQLTPTSAWRAAERLAKVAIMRKSMNRVSDLHGFENARF